MVDPFFFDRLMHAFTTANSTPLNQAAEHAATSQRALASSGEASACRALREAEAVVAEAHLRARNLPAETDQPDGHDLPG
jgi:guanyl-specific ribonuclease Sa